MLFYISGNKDPGINISIYFCDKEDMIDDIEDMMNCDIEDRIDRGAK